MFFFACKSTYYSSQPKQHLPWVLRLSHYTPRRFLRVSKDTPSEGTAHFFTYHIIFTKNLEEFEQIFTQISYRIDFMSNLATRVKIDHRCSSYKRGAGIHRISLKETEFRGTRFRTRMVDPRRIVHSVHTCKIQYHDE